MVRKNIYPTPIVATYRYEVMTLDRRIESYITRVQVLASTDKSYQVRLVEPIRAHWAGDVLWVMKKNINIEQPFCDNKKVCQNVKKRYCQINSRSQNIPLLTRQMSGGRAEKLTKIEKFW